MKINFEAEEVLIGALVAKPQSVASVFQLVAKDDFVNVALGRVFAAMVRLYIAGKPMADVRFVIAALKDSGVVDDSGGINTLTTDQLLELQGDPSVIEVTAAQVVRAKQSRQLKQVAIDLANDDRHPSDVLASVKAELAKIERRSTARSDTLRRAIERRSVKLRKAFVDKKSSCVPTFIEPLDGENIGGFMPGELAIVAASTGAGKTTFAMEMISRRAEQGSSSLIMSLEMLEDQISDRAISRLLQFPISTIRSNQLTEGHLNDIDYEVKNTMNGLDHGRYVTCPGFNIDELSAAVRAECMQHDYSMVFIDYLTKIRKLPRHDMRTHAAHCSNELKTLAGVIGKPVVCLAQLNRAGSAGADGKFVEPSVGNLAESSAIEQDADFVILLYGSASGAEEDYVMKVAKARQGKRFKSDFKFFGDRMKMSFTTTTYPIGKSK